MMVTQFLFWRFGLKYASGIFKKIGQRGRTERVEVENPNPKTLKSLGELAKWILGGGTSITPPNLAYIPPVNNGGVLTAGKFVWTPGGIALPQAVPLPQVIVGAESVAGSLGIVSFATSGGGSSGGRKPNEVKYKTNKEAKAAAEKLGYRETNQTSQGRKVFHNPKGNPKYITVDQTAHNGGVWKGADTIGDLASKTTRSGTYDEFLNMIGD